MKIKGKTLPRPRVVLADHVGRAHVLAIGGRDARADITRIHDPVHHLVNPRGAGVHAIARAHAGIEIHLDPFPVAFPSLQVRRHSPRSTWPPGPFNPDPAS